ncbi:MAG: hypothetical protein WDO13_12225 [Verrucomicrobiota bacterium]
MAPRSFWFAPLAPAPADPGLAVFYKGNNARWMKADGEGAVPNFVPATFDPKGRTFHQLTPGGVLR